MAVANYYKGNKYALYIKDGAATEFTKLVGFTTVNFSSTNAVEDVTIMEDGMQSASAYGRQTITATASGFCRPDTDHETLRTKQLTQAVDEYRFVGEDGKGYEGTFLVTSFSFTSGVDGPQAFDVAFQNAGPVISYTAPVTP